MPKCSLCLGHSTAFVDTNALHSHQSAKHDIPRGYLICRDCPLSTRPRSFVDANALEDHKAAVHLDRYRCICGKAFRFQESLDQHRNTVHPRHICFCGKAFRFEESLEQHKSDVHTYSCRCGRVFSSSDSLTQHKRDKHHQRSHSVRRRTNVHFNAAPSRYCPNPSTLVSSLMQPSDDKDRDQAPSITSLETPDTDSISQHSEHDSLTSLGVPRMNNMFQSFEHGSIETVARAMSANIFPAFDPSTSLPLKIYTNTITLLKRLLEEQNDSSQEKNNSLLTLEREGEATDMEAVVSVLAESRGYRERLLKWCCNLDFRSTHEPLIYHAFAKDDVDIDNLLHALLLSQEGKSAIERLEGESQKAERFMDLLHPLSKSFDDARVRQEARRLLRRLRNACDKVLFIRNVVLEERDAVFHGGFADIFCGRHEGRNVALKLLRVCHQDNPRNHRKLHREARLWQKLSHPCLLPFLGVDVDTFPAYDLCLVSPWMKNGTIMQYLDRSIPTGFGVHHLLHGIAQAIAYLHSSQIVHGDICGRNILIDDEGIPRVADFGLAWFLDISATSTTHGSGSPQWMAPELFNPDYEFKRTCASDVYAFACTIIEIHKMGPPWGPLNNMALLWKAMQGTRPERPKFPESSQRELSDPMWSLVQRLWEQIPSLHPEMEMVVKALQEMGETKLEFGMRLRSVDQDL